MFYFLGFHIDRFEIEYSKFTNKTKVGVYNVRVNFKGNDLKGNTFVSQKELDLISKIISKK